MTQDFLLFILQTIKNNEPLGWHGLLDELKKEDKYFDLTRGYYQQSLYHLEDNK